MIIRRLKFKSRAIGSNIAEIHRQIFAKSAVGQKVLELFGATTADDKFDDLTRRLEEATKQNQVLKAFCDTKTHEKDDTIAVLQTQIGEGQVEIVQLGLHITQLELDFRCKERSLQSKAENLQNRLDDVFRASQILEKSLDDLQSDKSELQGSQQALEYGMSDLRTHASSDFPRFTLSQYNIHSRIQFLYGKSKAIVDFERSRFYNKKPLAILRVHDVPRILVSHIRSLDHGAYPVDSDVELLFMELWSMWEDPASMSIGDKETLFWPLYEFCWIVIKHHNKPCTPLHQWVILQLITALVVYGFSDGVSDDLDEAMANILQLQTQSLTKFGQMGLEHLRRTIDHRLRFVHPLYPLHLTAPFASEPHCTRQFQCEDVRNEERWHASCTFFEEDSFHLVLYSSNGDVTMRPVVIFNGEARRVGFVGRGAHPYLLVSVKEGLKIWKVVPTDARDFLEWSETRNIDVTQELLSVIDEQIAHHP